MFHGSKRAMECCQGKMLEDRGALSEENGNQRREYEVMHEENFLSSWLREEVVEKKQK